VVIVVGADFWSGLLFAGWGDNSDAKKEAGFCFLFLLGGFFFLGQLRYTYVWSFYSKNDIYRYSQVEPRLVTVRGRIVRSPYISKSRGRFADFVFRHEARTIFTLDCFAIQAAKGWDEVEGKALVVIKKPALNLRVGQEVEIDGWLSRRGGLSNPGQYDRRDGHRAHRTLVTLRSGFGEAVKIVDEEMGLVGWRNKMQQGADRALFSDTETEGETNRAFLAALLLGDREGMYDGLSELFIRCGSLHFLSVSGLHLGILAGFVWWLGWVLSLTRWLQGLLPLMVVLAFMLIVPERPPIMRAGIMSSVFCIAYMTRRRSSSLNLLPFAAMVILLLQPLDLFNAGFQLSFIVVLALFVFVPMVYRFEFFVSDDPLARVRKKYRRQGYSWVGKLMQWFIDVLWRLASVALVAWLIGMPLSAYYFNRIAPWGILASIVLFLPIAMLLLLGLSKF
jgi:competence protein ComEC